MKITNERIINDTILKNFLSSLNHLFARILKKIMPQVIELNIMKETSKITHMYVWNKINHALLMIKDIAITRASTHVARIILVSRFFVTDMRYFIELRVASSLSTVSKYMAK